MVKTWVTRYLPMQEEFENLCFIAVLIKNQMLWSFVHVTLKWLLAIDLSSWISSLFVVKQGSRGINLPMNLFLIHGKQDGAIFKPVQQFTRKLQPF